MGRRRTEQGGQTSGPFSFTGRLLLTPEKKGPILKYRLPEQRVKVMDKQMTRGPHKNMPNKNHGMMDTPATSKINEYSN